MGMNSQVKRRRRHQLLGDRGRVECHYCGCVLTAKDVTLDHVHPQAKGGRHGISNIVPACSTCNRMKGDLDYQGFLTQCLVIARSVA